VSERARWLISLMTVIVFTAVGIAESARLGEIGLVALLGVVGLVTLSLVVSLRRRAPIVLRSDLATWVETTSAITGESATQLADRAVSAYRERLGDERGR